MGCIILTLVTGEVLVHLLHREGLVDEGLTLLLQTHLCLLWIIIGMYRFLHPIDDMLQGLGRHPGCTIVLFLSSSGGTSPSAPLLVAPAVGAAGAVIMTSIDSTR
jgi:hypothetical protein